jgi:hypothetical protein
VQVADDCRIVVGPCAGRRAQDLWRVQTSATLRVLQATLQTAVNRRAQPSWSSRKSEIAACVFEDYPLLQQLPVGEADLRIGVDTAYSADASVAESGTAVIGAPRLEIREILKGGGPP